VGQIVADMRTGFGCDAKLRAQCVPRRELVADVEQHVLDVEAPRAMLDRWRGTAGDPRDDDAGAAEKMHADAVERGKRLRLVTEIVDVDLAVGGDAFDVPSQG